MTIQFYVNEVTVSPANGHVYLTFDVNKALDIAEDIIPYLTQSEKEQMIVLLNE